MQKIYVQSRGKSQEHDHCWLEIREGKQLSISPEEFKDIKPKELIDGQKPSMILARSGKHLMLLVMSLKAGGRLDFMGRQIRNSVAWIADEDFDEPLLRRIAIQALEGDREIGKSLADAVNEAVENAPDNKYGFTVDFGKLKKIGNSSDSKYVRCEEASFESLKFGGDNESIREELVKELTKYALPKSSEAVQILVVITTMKSEDGLRAKHVWRGLSSRILSEEWIPLSALKDQEGSSERSKKWGEVEIIAFLILALILVMVLLLFLNYPVSQKPQPKSATQLNLLTVNKMTTFS